MDRFTDTQRREVADALRDCGLDEDLITEILEGADEIRIGETSGGKNSPTATRD